MTGHTERTEERTGISREPTGENTLPEMPVQYFRSREASTETVQKRDVKMHWLSPNRKSTLVAISLLMTIALTIAGTVTTLKHYNQVEQATSSPRSTASSASPMHRSLRESRNILLALSIGSLTSTMAVVFILLRAGTRMVALELWIRRMGAGDLTHTVNPTGNDEITELTYDLEILRRRSVRSLQLDLVQQLSEDLQTKNDELEDILQQLRRTQNQMVSRQKLVELGELAAGVAHEIRNPLNFIRNFSQTSENLMRELLENLPPPGETATKHQKELVDEIANDLTENMTRMRDHSDRANRIVQEMLAMGRNTTGTPREVDINQLLQDNVTLAYQAARANDTDFNLDIIENLDPNAGQIQAVPEDLGRVFLNIVSNACYATNERAHQDNRQHNYQPTLTVSTKRTPGTIEIQITDNGNGIPPEIINQVFNPFFTTKPPDKGTGLGLGLCSDIIRQHQGTITPQSEPGHHTTMLVSIPTNPQTGEQQ